MTGRTPNGAAGSGELSATMSRLLVAFTTEFDNEFEHHLPHRTASFGPGGPEPAVSSAGRPMRRPWLASQAMWSNCLRFVTADGAPFGSLDGLGANLAGLERWGYIVVAPDARAADAAATEAPAARSSGSRTVAVQPARRTARSAAESRMAGLTGSAPPRSAGCATASGTLPDTAPVTSRPSAWDCGPTRTAGGRAAGTGLSRRPCSPIRGPRCRDSRWSCTEAGFLTAAEVRSHPA